MKTRAQIRVSPNIRLILCCNCKVWKQAPNPEMGTCKCDTKHFSTNYDTRCLLGLTETVIHKNWQTITKT